MRKVVVITVLILVCFVEPSLAADTPFTIQADDHVVFAESGQQIEAEGNVVVKLEDASIKADKVNIILDQKLVRAEGNVVLIDGSQEVTGRSLEYNYETEEGKLVSPATKKEEITFKGKRVKLQKEKMVMEETTLTPCLLDDPHYKLTAKEVTVYPEDANVDEDKQGKIIATDVWLWVRDHKFMPLPTYTTSLDEEEREKESIPEISLSYNTDDGAYVEVDYDHYVNEDLEGQFHAKAATKKTNQLYLDYTYKPNQYFTFNPRLEYNQEYGLNSQISLNNQFGDTTSKLKYSSYLVEDEDDNYQERIGLDDDEDYDHQERKWAAEWNLNTKINDIGVATTLAQDEDDENLNRKLAFTKNWSDYYWQLEASKYFDVDYKPQLTIGVRNKDIGNGTLFSGAIKKGKVYEKDIDVEADREQIRLNLNKDYQLTDYTNFHWNGEVVGSSYGTGTDYSSYNFDLGLDRELPFLNLNLDYQYHGDQGETPFDFDDLITDGLGDRHLVAGSVGQQDIKLGNDVSVDWNLFANRNFYETGVEYGQYGLDTEANYQIDKFNSLAVGYNYQALSENDFSANEDYDLTDEDQREDAADDLDFISQDDLAITNELSATYNFQTNKKAFPYWDVEINTAYDFIDHDLSELDYSFTREFDCFNAQFNIDQLEKSVSWKLDFKY
ncbi:LptA/OstA family protein [Halanaerocella petrolearia]